MKRVTVMIDEAAALQHFDPLVDAVTQLRGYGVRMVLAYQSPSQLRACFKDGLGDTLLANVTPIYFAANEYAVAEQISNRVGEHTVAVESGGTSYGSSTQWSDGQQPTRGGGGSYGTSANWQQQARKLLPPEEVLALDPRTAISFVAGMPPVMTRLLAYFEEPWLKRGNGFIRRSLAALVMLVASASVFAGMLAMAVGLTVALNQSGKLGRPLPLPAGIQDMKAR